MRTYDVDGQASLFVPDGFAGKMSQGCSAAGTQKGRISKLSSSRLSALQAVPFLSLDLTPVSYTHLSLHLIKLSSDGSRLAGVTFRIAKIEDGSHYLDRTTDSNGEILISGLEPGVYSVKELDRCV